MGEVIRLRDDAARDWIFVGSDDAFPENGYAVVPLSRLADALAANTLAGVGVRIEAGEDVAGLMPSIARLSMIELSFPTFRDGRNYSSARILRSEMGYPGEIRAVGDVLVDQLHFMVRAGIDSLALNPDIKREHAEAALKRWTDVYQKSSDDRKPVWESRI
jgi:uncharacterized protein (DUF934 family)